MAKVYGDHGGFTFIFVIFVLVLVTLAAVCF